MQKTTYLKLITGTYVIGELAEESTESVKLIKPFSVEFNPMAGGLTMVPYDAFYLNEEIKEIEIDSKFIMHKFNAPKELEAKYIEMKSGIITNPSNDVTPGTPQMTEELLGQLAKESGLIIGDK